MTKEEAKDILRGIARLGTVGLSNHCRKRMRQRNICMDDILYVLAWGTVEYIEEIESNTWKCTIAGEDIEGD